MTKTSEVQQVFDYWNAQPLMKHKVLNNVFRGEIKKALENYSLEDLKGFILLYATILEKGKKPHEKKYFWTYEWNLYEFLKRGIIKFDGKEAKNYLKTQFIEELEAVVIKRK